ncbi:hypothetical protein IW15_22020 [Chryseobacterium soli]|uniref:Uncharacterized protein n=1 Tax=Chryseobacterium soli TaxID=445961 RepID=A0A085ZZR6_9FLAO|nr:hypothetical protein [Chryseobacterium soli]KFF09930.1 hypothetical protein IW15_22020 [Chryseobacterium soli]
MMSELTFEMINRGDYLLRFDDKEILVKRNHGGFIFTSKFFINKEHILTSKLKQILFYRKLKIEFSKFIPEISMIDNNTFRINNEIITHRYKALNINPNYSFYSNNNLILECYVPKIFSSNKKYRLLVYNKNENMIAYIICFFIIFSLDNISIE